MAFLVLCSRNILPRLQLREQSPNEIFKVKLPPQNNLLFFGHRRRLRKWLHFRWTGMRAPRFSLGGLFIAEKRMTSLHNSNGTIIFQTLGKKGKKENVWEGFPRVCVWSGRMNGTREKAAEASLYWGFTGEGEKVGHAGREREENPFLEKSIFTSSVFLRRRRRRRSYRCKKK